MPWDNSDKYCWGFTIVILWFFNFVIKVINSSVAKAVEGTFVQNKRGYKRIRIEKFNKFLIITVIQYGRYFRNCKKFVIQVWWIKIINDLNLSRLQFCWLLQQVDKITTKKGIWYRAPEIHKLLRKLLT